MQVDVAWSHFLNLDIATSGSTLYRTGNFACPNIAGTCLEANLALQASELYIARPGLHIHIPARSFDGLIAGAAVRANRSVGGNGDLVVDGDIVAFLFDRRIRLDRVHIRVAVPEQPVIAHEDLSVNLHAAGRAGAHAHIAGMGKDLEVNRPRDLQRSVKGALRRGPGKSRSRCKQYDQRDDKQFCRSVGLKCGMEHASFSIHIVVTPLVSYPRRA